jgi:hypothetical protein
MKLARLTIPAIALTAIVPLAAYSATQQTADKTAKVATSTPAKPNPQEQALFKFSEAGHAAIQNIRGARFAIFNGEPKVAIKRMESAKSDLTLAEKEAPTFDTTSTMLVGGKVVGTTPGRSEVKNVPVDGQLTLADDFVMTPEKKVHIEKANEHFRKGEHAKAREELRLGEIDVNFTRAWMPIEQSQKHLDQAIKLANDGKYYEANLALKAIEEGVTIDSTNLRDLPKNALK